MKIFKKLPFLTIFLLLLCVTTTIISCEKDEIDKLPAETMSGRNTFGCLIDGEAFLPKKITWTSIPVKANYILNEDAVEVRAFNSEKHLTLGIYTTKIGNVDNQIYFQIGEEKCFFQPDNNNKLEITHFDLSNRIISGTFSFLDLNTSCSSNYLITEGRFDIQFDIY